MNTFEILILALALVFNSWLLYLNAGTILADESALRKVHYTLIMFLLQFIMAGAGIWVGCKVGSAEMKINTMISFGILAIFGIKILLSGIWAQSPEKEYDITDNKATLFTALAEGITASGIGISIGLLSVHPYLHWILIGVFLLTGIVASLIIAPRVKINSFKFKPAFISGLLFLAAAIKLMLNITGF